MKKEFLSIDYNEDLPIVTSCGYPARIVDRKFNAAFSTAYNLVAIITCPDHEEIHYYNSKGKVAKNIPNHDFDLFKVQTVFEDEDVVYFGNGAIGIFKCEDTPLRTHTDYATLDSSGHLLFNNSGWTYNNIRLATTAEREKLINALNKAGKDVIIHKNNKIRIVMNNMKTYTARRTKRITASPMSFNEAKELGYSAIGNNVEGEGYAVREGSNKLWIPRREFEDKYQCIETYKERLALEYNELTSKIDNLEEFLDSDTFDKLPQNQQQLLIVQASAMTTYSCILEQRLDINE